MENIFNTITPSIFSTTSTGVVGSLAPLVALLLGISIAFLVIDYIVVMLSPKKNKEIYKRDQYEDEDEDDFPY